MQNVVIIGSGPAGYTAAIYAARANLNPILIAGPVPGGQLTISFEIENFPGVVEPISGLELMQRMQQQAEKFGTNIIYDEVLAVERSEKNFVVKTANDSIESKAVIIATGAVARRLPIASEPKFYGRGVSGCATCDGAFFRNKEVLVIGGGNTAMEDAAFLTRFASKVTIVHRREYFRASQIEIDKNKNNPKIAWKIPYVIEEILGENVVNGALLKNIETNETEKIDCQGIFVAIGHDAQSKIFSELVDLDENKFMNDKFM